MVLVRVLKRKDAASVVVAIVIAMILAQLISSVTGRWAGMLSGLDDGQYFGSAPPGSSWQGEYLYPVLWAALQLLVLEILGWIYVLARSMVKRK
jgi:hypothetical protein